MAPRVLLVAGPGGAGASTVAAALADRLAADGRAVTVLDDDPYDGAGARCRQASVVRGPEHQEADRHALSAVWDSLGAAAELLDPLRQTLTASTLQLLWSLPLDHGADHTVIVDSGTRGPELARLARTLPGTLLRMSRLVPAWLRGGRPVLSAIGVARPHAVLLTHLQEAARRSRALRHAVCGASGGALLVAGEAAKTARLGVGIALSGVHLRGVVGLGDDVDDALLPGVPRLRADASPPTLWTDTGLPVRIEPEHSTEGYRLRMLLPLHDFRQLRLRWAGHSVTLSACGHRSVLELPSALQRCHPSSARLRDGMLDVAFSPIRAGA